MFMKIFVLPKSPEFILTIVLSILHLSLTSKILASTLSTMLVNEILLQFLHSLLSPELLIASIIHITQSFRTIYYISAWFTIFNSSSFPPSFFEWLFPIFLMLFLFHLFQYSSISRIPHFKFHTEVAILFLPRSLKNILFILSF